ncbi:MAG: hypothetical protein EOO71_26095 [Myxococcaceae bacterium]|nr:MAG: hypothetical protein EOO71_26095 [Myxococcaceae bacterium]
MDARSLLTLPLLALLACGDSLPSEEEGSASCEPQARGVHDPARSGPLEVVRPLDAAEQAHSLEDGARGRATATGAPGPRTPTLVWTEGVDLPMVGGASLQLRQGSSDREASRRILAPAR